MDAANRNKFTLSHLPWIQCAILPATNQMTSIWMPTQWCRLWRWMHWIRNIAQWLTLTLKKTISLICTRYSILGFGWDWHLQYRRKLWPKPHDLDWMMQQRRAAAAYAKRIPCSQHSRLKIAPLCQNTVSFSLLNSTVNTRYLFRFGMRCNLPIFHRRNTKDTLVKFKTLCIHDNLTPHTQRDTNTCAILDKQVDDDK